MSWRLASFCTVLSGACVPELLGLMSPSSVAKAIASPIEAIAGTARADRARRSAARPAPARPASRARGCADGPGPSARPACSRRAAPLADGGAGGRARVLLERSPSSRALAVIVRVVAVGVLFVGHAVVSCVGGSGGCAGSRSRRMQRWSRGDRPRQRHTPRRKATPFTKTTHAPGRSQRQHRARVHLTADHGVHKNDTSCQPTTDSLARGVRSIAHTASIARIELLPPPASVDADSYPSPTSDKGAITCAHTAPSSSPDPRAGPRRAGRRGRQAPDHRRLDLRPAARPETRHRLPQGLPEDPRARRSRAASPTSASDGAASGRFDIGDSSRDPIVDVDPKGLVFTKIARDGVCMITNDTNPISNLSQEEVEGIFTGQASATGAKCRAPSVTGPIDLFDRDGASGTAGRLPAHLPRRNAEDLPERDGRGLQRPGAERGRQRQTGDRLRVLRLHRRRQRRSATGHRLQPAQRQVRPVRGRA